MLMLYIHQLIKCYTTDCDKVLLTLFCSFMYFQVAKMTVCNAGYTSCFNIHENVVFHKTKEVALNKARWLVTFVHDLRPYEQFISTISNDLDQTNDAMETLIQYYRKTNQTRYVDTIHSLHAEIAYVNDTHGAV